MMVSLGDGGVFISRVNLESNERIYKDKKIFVGDIRESFSGTPLQIFRQAIELSKLDSFCVFTNNPQFVEALEVLCGEENVDVFLRLHGETVEVSFLVAYDYLGNFYNIIDFIRISKSMNSIDTLSHVENKIKKYEKKYVELLRG